MGISEIKKRIVIDNYFKTECDINTSIREAFEKGFELGLEKAPKKRKTDDIIDKIRAEIEGIIQEETVIDQCGGEYEHIISKLDPDDVLQILDKYRAESEE